MHKNFYLILTPLFLLLMAWGVHHNKPQAPAATSIIAQGYGGPIEMSLTVSAQGTIEELKVLRHNETTSYINRLDGFLKQFIGRTRKNSFIIGQDIDAISGATITSTAITRALKEKMNMTAPHENTSPNPLMPVVIPTALFLLATFALFARHPALRWAALAGGFVYFGIITHTMLSIIQITQTGLNHTPHFDLNPLGLVLLTLTFISAIVVGRIYCGSLCPFALIQEILFYLKPHKHPLTEHVDPLTDRTIRLTKYALLFMITGLCFILGNASAANIEPFITLFAGHGSKLAWSLLTLMLIMAVFNFRFWCKYLCPVGALTGLAATFSLNKIRPNTTCTACGTCSKICPTQAISIDPQGAPVIDPAECISCTKCLRACPVNALTFGCHGHEKK